MPLGKSRRESKIISSSSTDYSRSEAVEIPQCPYAKCLNRGNIDGIHLHHQSLASCPDFHNHPNEYFSKMRLREEGTILFSKNDIQETEETMEPSNPTLFNGFKRLLNDKLAPENEFYLFYRAYQKTISNPYLEVTNHFNLEELIKEIQNQENLVCKKIKSEDSIQNSYRLKSISFSDFELETLYKSPFPSEISTLPMIYFCEFCLRWQTDPFAHYRHSITCLSRAPPGNEIYRKDSLSFFEIDGSKHLEYCRNLCLLSRLFLKQKTVSSDEHIPKFLFYVLVQADSIGMHFVGYFSKQKYEDQMKHISSQGINFTMARSEPSSNSKSVVQSPTNIPQYNNLSCLLVMPHYRNQGFGRMLIEFSYNLSLIDGRIGSPEKPLSDSGISLYRKHWSWFLLIFLKNHRDLDRINMNTISTITGIAIKDVVSTLIYLGLIKHSGDQFYIIKDKNELDKKLKEIGTTRMDRRIHIDYFDWISTETGIEVLNLSNK